MLLDRLAGVRWPGPARRWLPSLAVVLLMWGCGGDAAGPDTTAPAVITVAAGDAQSGTVAMPLPQPIVVQVRDGGGRPVTGIQVDFTVTAGAGFVRDTALVADDLGRATTTWYLGPTAGMDQELRASAAGLVTLVHASAHAAVPGQTYFGRNGYVEYVAGDLPIILSAPHGGTLEPAELPDRTWGTTVRDTNTEELARALAAAIAQITGGRPHLVLSHLRRIKLDPNREIVEAAEGNPLAELAWKEYHGFLDAAAQEVSATAGRGLYIDVHGHGHSVQRLELGYLLDSNTLALPDTLLNQPGYRDASSVRSLARASPLSFSQLIRGPHSLGALFVAAGYPAVPSPDDLGPGYEPYFSGGYSTERHGSRDGGSIDGIQLECNFTGVRDTQANWQRFAATAAAVITQYHALQYTAESAQPHGSRVAPPPRTTPWRSSRSSPVLVYLTR